MKNLSIVLNAVLFIAVAILFYLYVSLNNKLGGGIQSSETSATTPKVITDPTLLANAKIAYVNIDTINSRYEYISDYSKVIIAKRSAIEGQMASMQTRLQQDYEDLQQSAQAGLKSEAELKKDEAKLQQGQYELASKEKQLQNLGEEVAGRQAEMMQNMSTFIAKYSNGKFDYILAYTHNVGSILYAKPDLEITQDILKGLNDEYRASKTNLPAKK